MRLTTRFRSMLLACALAPASAFAQSVSQPGDEMIPRELVLALLNFGPGMGGASEIHVGKLADGIPVELVPPGMQVLGSTRQFDNSVVVVAAPQQPDSAIDRIEAHLLASGWTKPPIPQSRPQRGFVPAEFALGSYQAPDMVCRDDAYVAYTGTYRRNGGTVIRLTYNRGQRYSACRTREAVEVYRNPFEEAPIPTLRAPAGSMTKDGTGMSGSGQSTVTMGTRLGTRLKPAEVLAHYDKQMRDQGWTAGSEGSVPFLAARLYQKTDDKARAWGAVLMSMFGADSTDQDVSLKLTRK